ncbi:MAG TPA: hypothetical protein VGX68_19575 [Thermoanaerobaculia bacterium]|jgi:hypothetical protein|nr:hypothetical protein [Thermoanaerobaculia bacterium]
MVPPEEALTVILEVARALEDLQVPYAVGGSLASSLHGIPRSTQDGDLVADLRAEHVQPFLAAVADTFYVSPERVLQAVQRRSSFNLVHLKTMIKVDLFVLKAEPLSLQEMARRQVLSVPGEPGTTLHVASAEDTILQKLLLYEKGGRVSDRQWNDILGVLKVQRAELDFDYLKEWADRAGVDDLLRQAYEDAGVNPG